MYLEQITPIVLALGIITLCSSSIERVDDTDLIHILTGEGDVIALFTKANCEDCVKYEAIVDDIQEELKQTVQGVQVVQALDSNLIHIYDPSGEPALIYFRRGIPILYSGDINGDEILHFFSDNREPAVKKLSDETFEHLTQASTGATTGDWFIFFNSAECVLCQRLYAVWESVGGRLKRKINVARVNALGAGVSTAKRFKVLELPGFIYLRQGKLYRYTSKEYTPEAFIQFIEGGYAKNTHPESVPPPSSLMDEFSVKEILEYVHSLGVMPLALIGAFGLVILVFVLKSILKSSAKPTKTKKDK